MLRLLFVRLRARGHSSLLLKKLILEAANKVKGITLQQQSKTVENKDRLFLHLPFHPRGISRSELRAAFDATCNNFKGTRAEVKQVTVAFSRPTNLRDRLVSARLREVDGEEVATLRP